MSKSPKLIKNKNYEIFEDYFYHILPAEQKAFKKLEKSIDKHGKDYAKFATYELNPSTGEIEKKSKDGR